MACSYMNNLFLAMGSSIKKKVEKHCYKHLFLRCLAVSVYAEHNYGSVDFDANIGAMATCKRPTAGSYGTLTLWQRSNFSSIQTSADERERERESAKV